MQCMLFGQHAAAQWTNEHPGWALDPWLALRERSRCLTGQSLTAARKNSQAAPSRPQ